MEDMHIHLKKGVTDINIMRNYVEQCLKMGMDRVLFLDHGNRESAKHIPVLNEKGVIIQFLNNIKQVRQEYPNIDIKSGIESDFSYNKEFKEKELEIINNSKFNLVIGSVHGMGKADYKDYLQANIDMINTYPINIVGHLKLRKEYENYKTKIEEIVKLASKKNIMFDVNTSDRSRWNIQQLEFMLDLFKKYNTKYTLGSDAHCVEEIGYGIKEMEIKIDKILKDAERDIEYTIVSRGTEIYGSKGYMGVTRIINNKRLFLLSNHFDKYIDTYKDSFEIPIQYDIENIAFSRFEMMSALTIDPIRSVIRDNVLIVGLGNLGFSCLVHLIKLGYKNIKILTRNVQKYQTDAIKILNEQFKLYISFTEEYNDYETYIDATGNSEVIKNMIENSNNTSSIILLGTPRDEKYYINPLDINRKSLKIFGGHELNGHTNEERKDMFLKLLEENKEKNLVPFVNTYKSGKNVVENILNKKKNIIEVIKYDL